MKKFFAALCAAVMVLGSTMTALAAPSATASDVNMTSANASAINVSETSSPDGKVSIGVASDASVNALQGAVVSILQNMNTDSKAYKATVLAVADIKIDGKNGGTVTIAVNGIKKGDNIKVLHWNGAWEESSVSNKTVENGKVTATFASLSPVAIVKVSEKVTSDETGVGVSTLSLIAAAGLAGAVVCGKKKSN